MAYDPIYHREYYQRNKERKRALGAAWEKDNPEKVREIRKRTRVKRVANGKDAEVRQRWERSNRDYILWSAARQRARRGGIEFTISRQDVVIPERCPVLGIELNVTERGRMRPDSPSLDKIDPTKGYVPGNVWVISWRANRMKSDASPTELRLFCEGMLRLLNTESATVQRWLGRAEK